MILDIVMGGSTNTILHLLAVTAQKGDIDFSMNDIDRFSRRITKPCKVAPNTTRYNNM